MWYRNSEHRQLWKNLPNNVRSKNGNDRTIQTSRIPIDGELARTRPKGIVHRLFPIPMHRLCPQDRTGNPTKHTKLKRPIYRFGGDIEIDMS
jgi:hypothetical protein